MKAAVVSCALRSPLGGWPWALEAGHDAANARVQTPCQLERAVRLCFGPSNASDHVRSDRRRTTPARSATFEDENALHDTGPRVADDSWTEPMLFLALSITVPGLPLFGGLAHLCAALHLLMILFPVSAAPACASNSLVRPHPSHCGRRLRQLGNRNGRSTILAPGRQTGSKSPQSLAPPAKQRLRRGSVKLLPPLRGCDLNAAGLLR